MPDQLEIRGPHGERLLTPVHEGGFVVGSDAAADVRVDWPGIGPQQFRFVRTAAGVRVEPVRPGGMVEVNGEELFCKDLVAGDVIEVAGVQLRWLPAAPVPGARPPRGDAPPRDAADGPRRSAPDRRTAARGRSRPAWVPVLLLVAVVCGIGFGAVRWFGNSTWPSSPQRYVDLARAQLANQQMQRALDTLAFALREASGPTRAEALQLEAEIRRVMLESAEMPKVMVARQEQDLLLEFAGRYLRDGGEQPAARELVRLCDQWLQKHRDVCARVGDGQPLLRTVEDLRARWLTLAALSEPDTGADVVFAARSRLRFQWRDYRGAIARIDAFLATRQADAAVRAERDAIVAEGLEWLRGRLRNVDLLLDRSDTDNAEKDLAQIERWSMLPEWAPMVAERRQRLATRR